MKTVLIYLSKHGTTEKVARMIQERLSSEEITMVDISKDKEPDFSGYERIIIGVSVYVGRVRKPFVHFCTDENVCLFATKDLGLFVCGMEQDACKQSKEMENAFPERLLRHAKTKSFMGGELLFDKLSYWERAIAKFAFKASTDVSTINVKAIDEFVEAMEA